MTKEEWFLIEAKKRGFDYGVVIYHLNSKGIYSYPQTFNKLKTPKGTFYDYKRDEGYFGGYLIYRGEDDVWARIVKDHSEMGTTMEIKEWGEKTLKVMQSISENNVQEKALKMLENSFTLSDMEHCWDEATKSLYKDTGNVPMITGNTYTALASKEEFEAYIKKNYSNQ